MGVGLQRRHQIEYLEGIKQIFDGALGDLTFMRVYWNNGDVWNHPRQPNQTEMQYQIYNWYHFLWICGDNIIEQHVHNIDVANWVKGKGDPLTHPVEANGMGGRQTRKGPGHTFDHHVVEFTYADGIKLFSQCRQQNGVWDQVDEFIHGVKGCRQPWIRVRHPAVGPYQQEHADLLKAIRTNQPYNEGWHGATATMTGILGRMASYSGRIVKWDEAVVHGPNEAPEKFTWDALAKGLARQGRLVRLRHPGSRHLQALLSLCSEKPAAFRNRSQPGWRVNGCVAVGLPAVNSRLIKGEDVKPESKSVSRRDFLNQSMIAGVAGFAGASVMGGDLQASPAKEAASAAGGKAARRPARI